MLNETASSTEDRPVLRSSVRYQQVEENPQQEEIRRMVATVMDIEREIHLSVNTPPSFNGGRVAAGASNGQLGESLPLLGADGHLAASFEGRLLLDSEQAYDRLDQQFVAANYLPIFRSVNGRHVIHVLQGRVYPRERSWWPNLLLLIATLFSVLIVGTEMALNEIGATNLQLARDLAQNFFLELWRGLPYALSIILILGSHELGHYFAARRHKLSVTLPYFIPLPISMFGTLGAFIQLRQPMRNRKVLLDVGVAGPLVGLIFAIPILLIGLATSQVSPILSGGMVEGNSILYALSKFVVFGKFLPNATHDVIVNQLAWAGWTGLLVTALNLIPIGQLDGGHILYSLLGEHARKLYYPLLAVLVGLTFVTDMWLLWVLLLFIFGRTYAAPLDMITPLDRRRKLLGILAMIIFVLIFVPIPITVTETPSIDLPRDSAMLAPMSAAVIMLFGRMRR